MLHNALCEVIWKRGVTLKTFVHASQTLGCFQFEGVPKDFAPVLVPPAYQKTVSSYSDSPVTGQDLQRLGYEQGKVVREPNKMEWF